MITEELKRPGKCFAMKGRTVGREAQMMPTLSSMVDQYAVEGLSHGVSLDIVRL